MLTLTIPETEFYDEVNNRFIVVPTQKITIEHSLKSIALWEQRHHKAFLSESQEKTVEESIDYIRCMTLTENVNPLVYSALNDKILKEIDTYLDDPMSAYKYSVRNTNYRYGSITAESIYFWMTMHGIPFTCEDWHLNRLLALIRYCQSQSGTEKKMSSFELAQYNTRLNQERRRLLHTKG